MGDLKWALLWALIFLVLYEVHSQNPSGYISLDCGLLDIDGYNDTITSLYYTSDEPFTDGGQNKSISPEFKTNNDSKQLWTLRSFPGVEGARNCYKLRPENGKNGKILLRVTFKYGNYDDQRQPPEFDLHIGVNLLETVKFSDSLSIFSSETIHTITSDYLSLCLVNKGLGHPFISMIEIRPLDYFNMYNVTSSSLNLVARWNFGSSTNVIRYQDDLYDRIWRPLILDNSTALSSTYTVEPKGSNVPYRVMSTAVEARSVNESLIFEFSPTNSSDQIHIYLHFAELVPNQTRTMNVYLNDVLWLGPIVPEYLSVLTVNNLEPFRASQYRITINSSTNSTLPASINAMEIYSVKYLLYFGTDENDVSGMMSIKETYGITRNWEGDPCAPKTLAWIGVNCSFNGFESPNIISLNLSSSGLTSVITPFIGNLTRLQSLDLSYNSLTGNVPDSLARLHSLRYLNLLGNNFVGSLPQELVTRSENGSLVLRVDPDNSDSKPRMDDASDTIEFWIIIIIIVAAAVLVILFLVLVCCCCICCKSPSKKEQNTEEKCEARLIPKHDSFLELRFRSYTFSEIERFITQKNIIGKGGFGIVYRGRLNDVDVAIKKILTSETEEVKDFHSEVNILAKVYHKNLTAVLGYFNEGTNKGIICEFVDNGTLRTILSGITMSKKLSWEQRISIVIDIGEGLEYLHHDIKPQIIHRDIKPSNILMTQNFQAKIADFGLSRPSHVSTERVVGTPGYLDPQYIHPSMMSAKNDVYSFGIVMLEVFTGQSAIMEGKTNITQWISPKVTDGDLRRIMDHRLEGNYNDNIAWKVIRLAMDCVSQNTKHRPTMKRVVRVLKECNPSVASVFDESSSFDASQSTRI